MTPPLCPSGHPMTFIRDTGYYHVYVCRQGCKGFDTQEYTRLIPIEGTNYGCARFEGCCLRGDLRCWECGELNEIKTP
jgi:hypothetical protein